MLQSLQTAVRQSRSEWPDLTSLHSLPPSPAAITDCAVQLALREARLFHAALTTASTAETQDQAREKRISPSPEEVASKNAQVLEQTSQISDLRQRLQRKQWLVEQQKGKLAKLEPELLQSAETVKKLEERLARAQGRLETATNRASTHDQEVKKLTMQVNELQEAGDQLEALQVEKKSLQRRVKRLQEQVSQLAAQRAQAETHNDEVQRALDECRADQVRMRKRLAAQQREHEQASRAAIEGQLQQLAQTREAEGPTGPTPFHSTWRDPYHPRNGSASEQPPLGDGELADILHALGGR
ncbi:uncharacterized protein MONBRDRAFT_28841 [Monosiga brevicollis MX1]|uniref:Uncharacterized protein n=1 Tax=Monosiga brevicollis TaxID=81824 RepID=A9V978_MONBE|nr:uncharacterized protein MONBRDRAFT_28841 [Monosiga brevicollis MX1]EDQ85883.1 predicted protein [Monosiga brevicollis MX1]|eukprot:XP_001749362.1 hypothetical protein [Monosiga brevicollis MX1]